MESVMLTARVIWERDHFLAKVDQLPLEGVGESVEEAQDQLIQMMRSWIEENDGTDTLEQLLADAGFPGVAEETELQLEFVD
tara:strand:+ start:4443 stop:4688 length:246 start_codon:yes stop_codon:yes gene_type:complete